GLLLPFKLYFQHGRFANEIADLAPELPRKYSLWQVRHKWNEPAFRRAILILFAQFCVATLWVVVPLCLLSLLRYDRRCPVLYRFNEQTRKLPPKPARMVSLNERSSASGQRR